MTATQTSHFHETLRLCSEIIVFNLHVYDVLRLPRKMTFVTFLKTSKIITLPSVWNDFDHFHSHTLSSKSTFCLRLVTKTELFNPPCNCKSQWNSAIQHLQNTTLKLQIPMKLRRERVTFTKPCACAAKCITFLA